MRRWMVPVLSLPIIAYVFLFRFLPLQDYPDWLYQGFLFREYVFSGNSFEHFFALQPFIPPNAISTILIGLLSTFLDPELAGKIVLAMAMTLLYFGSARYIRFVSGRWSALAPFISLIFVFNLNFWLGNVNFIFGLGVALIGFELLIGRRWLESFFGSASLFLLAYLSHFFAYAILLYAVGLYLLAVRRSQLLWRLFLVNIPALLLLAWFVSSVTGDSAVAGAFDPAWQAQQRLSLFAGVLAPFQRFKGVSEPGLPLKMINYAWAVGVVAIAGLLAARWWRTRRLRFALLLAAPLPIVILALPLAMAGIVRPGERLVLFFAINLVATALAEFPRRARRLWPVVATLAIATFAYYVTNTIEFNRMIRSGNMPTADARMALAARGGTDGFLRLPYYAAIRERAPVPIFTSGLFTFTQVDSTARAR